MTIRLATAEDLPAMAALIESSIREVNAQEHTSGQMEIVIGLHDQKHLAAYLKRRQVFVLEEQGVFMGTVSLEADMLHSLFVAPAQVKRGFGRLLVRHIEELAKKHGVLVLRLNASITATPFYERLGYERVSLVERDFGRMWAMEKRL